MSRVPRPLRERLLAGQITPQDGERLLALLHEIASSIRVLEMLGLENPDLATEYRSGAWMDVAGCYAQLVLAEVQDVEAGLAEMYFLAARRRGQRAGCAGPGRRRGRGG